MNKENLFEILSFFELEDKYDKNSKKSFLKKIENKFYYNTVGGEIGFELDEILSHEYYRKFHINSVRRLSDGLIFDVGELVELEGVGRFTIYSLGTCIDNKVVELIVSLDNGTFATSIEGIEKL